MKHRCLARSSAWGVRPTCSFPLALTLTHRVLAGRAETDPEGRKEVEDRAAKALAITRPREGRWGKENLTRYESRRTGWGGPETRPPRANRSSCCLISNLTKHERGIHSSLSFDYLFLEGSPRCSNVQRLAFTAKHSCQDLGRTHTCKRSRIERHRTALAASQMSRALQIASTPRCYSLNS